MTEAATRPALILGSASPRRRELLETIGVVPDAVRAPDVDETPRQGEQPAAYCSRIVADKLAALEAGPDDIILCADTTVARGRRIFGKPADAGEAAEFLFALSGRRHRVTTCVGVRRGARTWHRRVETRVRMKRLDSPEINAYLASGEWQGKAGAYAVQGRAAVFVPWISGSYSAVVGLPLPETAALLSAAGYPVLEGWA